MCKELYFESSFSIVNTGLQIELPVFCDPHCQAFHLFAILPCHFRHDVSRFLAIELFKHGADGGESVYRAKKKPRRVPRELWGLCPRRPLMIVNEPFFELSRAPSHTLDISFAFRRAPEGPHLAGYQPVSYTHLTLPTKA